jgi:hypothetical protein
MDDGTGTTRDNILAAYRKLVSDSRQAMLSLSITRDTVVNFGGDDGDERMALTNACSGWLRFRRTDP